MDGTTCREHTLLQRNSSGTLQDLYRNLKRLSLLMLLSLLVLIFLEQCILTFQNMVFIPQFNSNLVNFLEIPKIWAHLDHVVNCTRYLANQSLTETLVCSYSANHKQLKMVFDVLLCHKTLNISIL